MLSSAGARVLAASSTIVVVAALAAAAHAGAPPVQQGSVVLVDKTWICRGPVDLTSVSVTFDQNVPDVSATPGSHDAVHLGSGCTGRIGRLTVVQYHGDGVKVGGGAHDLHIDGGSIRCYGHDVGKHQDGIQAMGGTNVTFSHMDVQCDSSNNAAFFVNRGTNSPEFPTAVTCQFCFLEGGGITVRIGNSIDSGVEDSTIVAGHIAPVRIDRAGAVRPVYVGNRPGTRGAGLTNDPLPPLTLKRIGAVPASAPLMARRLAGAYVVMGTLTANGAANVSVLSAGHGRPSIPFLAHSLLGSSRTGRTHTKIVASVAPNTRIPFALRFGPHSLRPGSLYRIVASAVDSLGRSATLVVLFRA
jgi:hypothetical protein